MNSEIRLHNQNGRQWNIRILQCFLYQVKLRLSDKEQRVKNLRKSKALEDLTENSLHVSSP